MNALPPSETIVQELQELRSVVEELTGLPSRWNGSVSIVDAASMQLLTGTLAMAQKEWSCAIAVNEIILGEDSRWRSLLHEMLHSVSVGMNREDYTRLKGWEEGVVEQVQRQIRPLVLSRLDVNIPEEVFVPFELNWPYNRYISALEEIRSYLGYPLDSFYLALLRTPLAERIAYVRNLSNSPDFLRVLAQALGKLR